MMMRSLQSGWLPAFPGYPVDPSLSRPTRGDSSLALPLTDRMAVC